MAGELNGRTAIVTGGTRGIGLASAKALAGAGANVVITGRDKARGEAATAEIAQGSGTDCLFLEQDVASPADWTRIITETTDRFGRLDILVANAGVSTMAPVDEMSLETFRSLNEVNLKGAYLAVQHGTAALRAHGEGGAIVLVASVMGKMSAPGYTHYSASKAGVRLLAKAAALELGPERIRVNAILPGIIHTDMTEAYDEATLAPVLVPLRRFGLPEEIAEAVLFAASDRGLFMTGADVTVDGGLTTR